MSKCHIVGNLMLRLMFLFPVMIIKRIMGVLPTQMVSLFTLCMLGNFRHVKINGSPVSLTENSAVFRKTDF